jgi:hypothetical protein
VKLQFALYFSGAVAEPIGSTPLPEAFPRQLFTLITHFTNVILTFQLVLGLINDYFPKSSVAKIQCLLSQISNGFATRNPILPNLSANLLKCVGLSKEVCEILVHSEVSKKLTQF